MIMGTVIFKNRYELKFEWKKLALISSKLKSNIESLTWTVEWLELDSHVQV